MRQLARRSLVLIRPVAAGDVLREADLDAMRPADGISPLRLDEVIGRRVARSLDRGAFVHDEDLEPAP
jgi:sialic acid synthase SpsE